MKKSALGKGIGALLGAEAGSSSPSPTQEMNSTREDQGLKTKILASDLMKEIEDEEKEKEENKSLSSSPLMVDVSTITRNEKQPRKIFKERQLRELSDSIKENGILQPLIVCKREEGGYELLAGERRFRAAKMAGLSQVPVVERRASEREKLVLALLENIQRADLNCVEEAMGYYELMNDFDLTQEEVAKKLGKERSSVANFLRILKLPRPVIDLLQRDLLSFGHAKVLVSEKDREKQISLADTAVKESLSIRQLEKLLKKSQKEETKKESVREDSLPDLSDLERKVESHTGLHVKIKATSKDQGQIIFKYHDKEEFNRIYEHLLRPKE